MFTVGIGISPRTHAESSADRQASAQGLPMINSGVGTNCGLGGPKCIGRGRSKQR